jgi:hypothetical protein
MGLYLPVPVRDAQLGVLHPSGCGSVRLAVGSATVQGWRLHQEDAVCCCPLDEDTSLCAVFDGHGGPEVRVPSPREWLRPHARTGSCVRGPGCGSAGRVSKQC